jgi:hypothetical protein
LQTATESRRQATREWNFVHFLAACAAFEVLLLVGTQVLLAFMGPVIHAPVAITIVVGAGGLFLLWFWIRMIVDFVRDRPEQHAVAWGWALFLGAYFGALAYFVAVWRPRHRVGAT